MKIMHKIYKTKNLSEYGKILSVLVVGLLVLGRIFIPDFQPKNEKQLFSVNGNTIKYDDRHLVNDFIQSIKRNKGYLCLGTSESTTQPGGNYYNFLNNDSTVKNKCSVLAGAGRTCGMYLPVLLNHQEEVKNLNIIYMINPVYWRDDLCKVSKEYWKRYSSYSAISSVTLSEENEKDYKVVTEYIDELNPVEKTVLWLENKLRNARSVYTQNLTYTLFPDKYYQELSYVSSTISELDSYKNFGQVNTEEIDTIWNINYDFHNKNWFKAIDESVDYRYRELESFHNVCKNLEVNITYIVCPYNERFIRNYASSDLAGYIKTVENIKNYLDKEQASYIDMSHISAKAGTFIDHQHYSSYGAYLIYLKVKEYLHEKMGN